VNGRAHDSSANTVWPGAVSAARDRADIAVPAQDGRGAAAIRLATLNIDYASRKKPIEALVADIHPPIAAFAAARGGQVHFVAHSMGGLLARVYPRTTSAGAARPRGHARHTQWRQRWSPIS